jgi:hypothetical protein
MTYTANKVEAAPSEFHCPITCELMIRPLMCRSGLSFERSAIMEWLQEHNNTCPMTRQPLTVRDLVPNRALQARIRDWCETNNIELGEISEESRLHTCLITECRRPIILVSIKKSEPRRSPRLGFMSARAFTSRGLWKRTGSSFQEDSIFVNV